MPSTRSQKKQAAAPAIQPPQSGAVTLNWTFFDKSKPQDQPLPIYIPLQEFEGELLCCRPQFAAELHKHVGFQADLMTLKFWMVCRIYFPLCT